MTLKQQLYLMLKEGWNFYRACYALGITPAEGSRLLHENDENRKEKKKKSQQQKMHNYTWCGVYKCAYCSDSFCNLRICDEKE